MTSLGVCAFDEFDSVLRAEDTELLELTHQLASTLAVLALTELVVSCRFAKVDGGLCQDGGDCFVHARRSGYVASAVWMRQTITSLSEARTARIVTGSIAGVPLFQTTSPLTDTNAFENSY